MRGVANSKMQRLKALLAMPSTYAGVILLFIACTLIFLQDTPAKVKDLLMVAFACVALLPGGGGESETV